MATTPVLKIDKMDQAPSAPETVVNAMFQQLEARTIRVLSRTTTAEPGSPSEGDAYILPSGTLTGTNWSGYSAGQLAEYIGSAWNNETPIEGWGAVWVSDRNDIMRYDGSSWIPLYIGSDLTIVVASSGGDFTTIQGALDYLDCAVFDAAATITIQVNDGTYTGAITLRHAQGSQIEIKGQNAYTTTITSVSSSSGSAGAYTVVLNVASVSNIAVNDYVLITGCASGTNTDDLNGCWKVTAVGASTIDITCTSEYSSAPSGAITGNIRTIKSIISVSGDALTLNNFQLGLLEDIVVVASGGNAIPISSSHASLAITSGKVGIGGGTYGIYIINGATSDLSGIVISNCTMGVFVDLANIKLESAYLTGCSTNGLRVDGGHAKTSSLVAAANASRNVLANVSGVITSSTAMTSVGSAGGFYAQYGGYISTYPGATVARNTTDYSPAINTEDSKGSWVVN